MRWLQLRFDFDSTVVRLPFDCLSYRMAIYRGGHSAADLYYYCYHYYLRQNRYLFIGTIPSTAVFFRGRYRVAKSLVSVPPNTTRDRMCEKDTIRSQHSTTPAQQTRCLGCGAVRPLALAVRLRPSKTGLRGR